MRTDPKTGLKRCPRCGLDLPPESYSTYPTMPDGLDCYCRECRRAAERERYRRLCGYEAAYERMLQHQRDNYARRKREARARDVRGDAMGAEE